MFGAFFRENPLVAAIAGTVMVALVGLIGSALVTTLFDRRRTAAMRREPSVVDEGRADPSYAELSGGGHAVALVRATAPARRSGFGPGVVAVAFLVGVLAGAATVAVSSHSVAIAVASLLNPGETGPAPGGHGPGIPGIVTGAPEPQQGDTPPAAFATPQGVGTRLAMFARDLKASLPRAAGPELSLTRVDLDGMRLSLGYAVGRVMSTDEAKAFDAYILRTAKSLFCGRESREIRFLSDHGVVFDMEYIDPDGDTVTRLRVEPGFCA